jgi:SAM-dependent methyltransferase
MKDPVPRSSEPIVADEMEAAYDKIQELEWSFAQLPILHAAAEKGLLGLLATEGEVTASQVSKQLDLHPVATVKVLRALVAMSILRGQEDTFEMRPGYRPLFDPGSVIHHANGQRHIFALSQMWARKLPGFLETGEWAKTPRDPESMARFAASMRALSYGITGRLDQALDLSQSRHLVDFGGGLGTYSIELCLRHPTLRATVIDVEAVAPLTAQEIDRHDLSHRVQASAGSYYEAPLPEDMDVALFANVLHQEQAEGAARLIARAAAGLRPGGQLVVVDFTLEESRAAPRLGAFFAINMRLFGDTYTAGDFRDWMTAAGLTDVTRTDLGPNKLVIVGRKPQGPALSRLARHQAYDHGEHQRHGKGRDELIHYGLEGRGAVPDHGHQGAGNEARDHAPSGRGAPVQRQDERGTEGGAEPRPGEEHEGEHEPRHGQAEDHRRGQQHQHTDAAPPDQPRLAELAALCQRLLAQVPHHAGGGHQ